MSDRRERLRARAPEAHVGDIGRLMGPLSSVWNRLPQAVQMNLEQNFLPVDPYEHPLPDEEVQLDITMAFYRDILAHLVLPRFIILLALAILLSVIIAIGGMAYSASATAVLLGALAPPALLLAVTAIALLERLHYLQWRLIKTNARLIISHPQPNSAFLVDNIELKGLPNVIDTNWARNPIWRIFQAIFGARDLYISMVGYQFVEGRAKVRDALVMPDVLLEDIIDLKELVFKAPTGGPQTVRFAEPQEVKISGRD